MSKIKFPISVGDTVVTNVWRPGLGVVYTDTGIHPVDSPADVGWYYINIYSLDALGYLLRWFDDEELPRLY